MGVLVVAIALALLTAARRGRVTAEAAVLGLASAIALAAIDVVYVIRGVISPIYLGDAAVEAVFVGVWTQVLRTRTADLATPTGERNLHGHST